jgi:hypothetical protein
VCVCRFEGWRAWAMPYIMISCCIAVRMLRRGPVHEERRSATRAARGGGRGRRTEVLGLVVRDWKRVKHKGGRERQLWCECESGNSLVRWTKAHSRSCHRSSRHRARQLKRQTGASERVLFDRGRGRRRTVAGFLHAVPDALELVGEVRAAGVGRVEVGLCARVVGRGVSEAPR